MLPITARRGPGLSSVPCVCMSARVCMRVHACMCVRMCTQLASSLVKDPLSEPAQSRPPPTAFRRRHRCGCVRLLSFHYCTHSRDFCDLTTSFPSPLTGAQRALLGLEGHAPAPEEAGATDHSKHHQETDISHCWVQNFVFPVVASQKYKGEFTPQQNG